jgi:uncharacterized lipoprotein YmbA
MAEECRMAAVWLCLVYYITAIYFYDTLTSCAVSIREVKYYQLRNNRNTATCEKEIEWSSSFVL